MATVKFLWNGIKVDGELYRASYSIANYKVRGIAENSILVYAKDYSGLPQLEGLQIENDSDIMTDYFEKDRIYIQPDNKYYNDALSAYKKMTEHIEKRIAKRNRKRCA